MYQYQNSKGEFVMPSELTSKELAAAIRNIDDELRKTPDDEVLMDMHSELLTFS